MCTQATLEDLCLKLGMYNLQKHVVKNPPPPPVRVFVFDPIPKKKGGIHGKFYNIFVYSLSDIH